MISLKIAPADRQLLTQVAQRARRELNDGAAEFLAPEANSLYQKVMGCTFFLELTPTESALLTDWVYDHYHASVTRRPDDQKLYDQLYQQLSLQYHELKSEYLGKMKKIQDQLNLMASLTGREEIQEIDLMKQLQIVYNEKPEPRDNTSAPSIEAPSPSQPAVPGKSAKKLALTEEEKRANVKELAEKMKNLAKKLR